MFDTYVYYLVRFEKKPGQQARAYVYVPLFDIIFLFSHSELEDRSPKS